MITVEGYSGCDVRIIKTDSLDYVVEKGSNDPKYVPRLLKQRDKQRAAHLRNTSPNVVIPNILYTKLLTYEDHTLAPSASSGGVVAQAVAIGMPFLHHTDSISFLMKASMSEIKMFSECLLDTMEDNVRQCTADPSRASPADVANNTTPCDIALFVDKLKDIVVVCNKNSNLHSLLPNVIAEGSPLERIEHTIVPALISYLEKMGERSTTHAESKGNCIYLPIGACHGDFTLSNVLVLTPLSGDGLPLSPRAQTKDTFRIALIDFLDSFVESPLADMAKLCQDLKYGWTLRLLSTPKSIPNSSQEPQSPYEATLGDGLYLRSNEEKSIFSALKEVDRGRPAPISEAAARRRRMLLHATTKDIIKDTLPKSSAVDASTEGFQSGAVQVFAAMHYIYEAMIDRYASYRWFSDYFPLFFIMNQLRVLQYSKDTDAAMYLYRSVEEEFKLFERHEGKVLSPA